MNIKSYRSIILFAVALAGLYLFALIWLGFFAQPSPTQASDSMSWPGGSHWPDTNGDHINAFGAGIIYHEGVYYWYGEYKNEGYAEDGADSWLSWWASKDMYTKDGSLPIGLAQGGFSCYSSRDLKNWKSEGVVLPAITNDRQHDMALGGMMERPKVIYNKKTGKFVMHFKLNPVKPGEEYATHRPPTYYGVAVADSPCEPFTYSHKYLIETIGGGDFNFFTDDDGVAYLFFALKPGFKLAYYRLSEDYQGVEGDLTLVSKDATGFEAPAVFKHNGTYFALGSGTLGWYPTVSRLAYATSLKGPWTVVKNGFAHGEGGQGGAPKTFGGQISFILPVQGKEDAFIAIFDVWRPSNPMKGTYFWLPIQMKDNLPVVRWIDEWDLSFFDKPQK